MPSTFKTFICLFGAIKHWISSDSQEHEKTIKRIRDNIAPYLRHKTFQTH